MSLIFWLLGCTSQARLDPVDGGLRVEIVTPRPGNPRVEALWVELDGRSVEHANATATHAPNGTWIYVEPGGPCQTARVGGTLFLRTATGTERVRFAATGRCGPVTVPERPPRTLHRPAQTPLTRVAVCAARA